MSPDKGSYKALIEKHPDAFAYCQVVLDDQGIPVDYIFIEVNKAFEKMTGLKQETIIGKKATEVLPGIEKSDFDWIGTYGQVALSGEPIRFESFSEPLGRWYDVSAYSDKPGYFAAAFHDISEHKKTEQALNETKALYSNLFDKAPLGYQSLDENGNILMVNKIWLETLGYSEEEVLGKWFGDFLTPEYVEAFRQRFPVFKEAGKIHSEFVMISRNGEPLTISFEGRIGYKEDGSFERTHCILQNITEQRRKELEKQHQNALFISLVDSIPDIIFIKDIHGIYLGCNDEFALHVGRDKEDVIGKTDYEFYPKEEADFFRENDKCMLEHGKSRHNEEWISYPDGRSVLLDTLKTPYRDADGNMLGVIGICRDITERKQAEETMRLNTIVLDQIKDHVAITNLEGDIIYVNQAEVESLKIPREKLIGANTDIFGENPEKGATQKEIRELTKRNGVWRGEVINYTADGQELVFDCRTQVIYNEQGKPIALCGISTDIAERKKVEAEIRKLNEKLEARVRERTAQLEAANCELDAFSYSASHDLRGPLNRISGFSEVLLEDYQHLLDRQGNDYLQRINNACEQMKLLIDDLLALSRVSQMEIRREPVELSAMVNVYLKELQYSEPLRKVETVVSPGQVVKGDTALLRIALKNLLDNAWKFSAGAIVARIEFGSVEHEDSRAYYIRDNGVGFDMKHADKLFNAFQRIHDAREYPGTGIGLSIVSRILARHGGKIWAESEPGKGATFFFNLPDHKKFG